MMATSQLYRSWVLLLLLPAASAAVAVYPGGAEAAADPRAIVVALDGSARFTVLTERVVRMERAFPGGGFEDAPSLVMINRRTPVPTFKVYHTSVAEGRRLSIHTASFQLDYTYSGDVNVGVFPANFTENELSVRLTDGVTWQPGTADTGNLKGTISSFNEVDWTVPDPPHIAAELGPGLLSRDGWTIWDDTTTPLFDANITLGSPGRLPWRRQRVEGAMDWYGFFCGRAYTQCLRDFTYLSGPIVMPPKSSLGIWWSHFEPLNQSFFVSDILGNYASHGLPLNHVELDLAWHITDRKQGGVDVPGCNGYGGFTWNETMWPDHAGFVANLHSGKNPLGHRLKLLLNTHAYLGVDHCQKQYQPLRHAMGLGPGNETVPLMTCNQTAMDAFFAVVLGSLEADYMWIDGARGAWYPGILDKATGKRMPTGDLGAWNMWWYSYVHDAEQRRAHPDKRSVAFMRYGGLGQHRVPHGFSGDADGSWTTLTAEVNMTKTASNVLFAYWSHDIGGFRPPKNVHVPPGSLYAPDEMMLRWVQFGALSPMFRTHGTKQVERRVWKYPSFPFMADAMRLRARLAPYLYTAAREAYDSGVGLLRPMYYSWPAEPNAYDAHLQYMLGSSLLVRPVTEPIQNGSQSIAVSVWLPGVAGARWVHWSSSTVFDGESEPLKVAAALADMPIYARTGSVLPLLPPGATDAADAANIHWCILPGESTGMGSRYDDAGDTNGYARGTFLRQNFSYKTNGGNVMKVTVGAVIGSYAGMPASVNHTLELRGRLAPTAVTIGGRSLTPITTAGHSLSVPTGTVLINVGDMPVTHSFEIDLIWHSPGTAFV